MKKRRLSYSQQHQKWGEAKRKERAEREQQRARELDVALPPLLTPTDVSRRLHVAVQTLALWRMRKIGPPFIKLHSRVLYNSDELAKWLRSKTHAPNVSNEK